MRKQLTSVAVVTALLALVTSTTGAAPTRPDRDKGLELAKRCPHQANINLGTPGGSRDRRDPYIWSSVTRRSDGRNTYRYRLRHGAHFCGIELQTEIGGRFELRYPDPTAKTATGGYYYDRRAVVRSIAFFARPPRRAK